jgi:integrase
VQRQEQEQGGLEIELFFDSIKSKETRSKYKSYWKKYLELTGIENPLAEKDPRVITRQIIDFINKMKKEGKNWGAIHNYVSMILAFYKINDIVLNTSKISKFMPEMRKVKKDRGYTHEEISKMLEISDERTRVIILLLASTGMRIGAIPALRIRNLQDNKITVYENDKEEYFSFITPECKQAIDTYLDMRSRYG